MSLPRIILHLDMNSYFASVEQQANPSYRGRPLGVAATMSDYGCLIATSKEAKAKGITTGFRVRDARAIDPNIIVVEVDPPKYRSTTEKIFGILAEYSEDIETYSIDEAFVNLTGFVRSFDEASLIANRIKLRIFAEAGEWLTCSMGIAPTRWLAKFGGDTAPKGGVVILTNKNLEAYLEGRELTEAWGIAERMAARFKDLGIRNLLELKRYSAVNLMEVFGIKGYEWWANLNAVELGGVQTPRSPKSVGHSHVLRKRTADRRFHEAVLMKLCEKTGRRLRGLQLEAGGFWLSLGTTMGGGNDSVRFSDRTADSRTLFRAALEILRREHTAGIPTFLAVGTFDLAPVSQQLSMFHKPKDYRVPNALDAINNKYGEYVITPGSMFGLAGHHAGDRIGFRKTVSWDIAGIDKALMGKGTLGPVGREIEVVED
ncbi:MAG: DNA polymerase IV [Candidatus Kerfeldbacteria bacterium]|nr:DNA polymerase IV [Candidatus Kerfeldbacteria bacterium]